jgi:glucose/arabinose dehydrogenase
VSTSGNEEGFLGFAFHPDFADSGRLFVYYSAANPRRSVISEIAFAQDGVGDEGSERIVMQVSQPEWNHNGGTLIFGPDGYLYISLGDGGGGGDPRGNGQNVGTILGSILRIDVDAPGVPYGIPPGNPFADREPVNGVVPAPEVWAYGLRNPWKLAFDPLTGEMWAGDVGQNRVEEVDLIVKGGNYGWNIKEGPDCYQPSSNCESQAQGPLIEPIASYTHSSGCSVTGGYVYRGSRLPSLYGAYIYADYCSGIIWALRYEDGEVTEQRIIADTSSQIPSFGQMPDGEVYILTASDGIQRFVAL